MTKWLFAASLGLCLASGAAGAADRLDFTPIPGGAGAPPTPGPLRPVHDFRDLNWRPVACVPSPHQCEHAAHDRGLRFHRVVQDEGACFRHPHLLCLGAE